MTWLLVTTLCAVTNSGAECETVSGHLRADRLSCEVLRQPMLDHVEAEASAAGWRLIYVAARCERGRDV